MKSLLTACLLLLGIQMGAFCQSGCATYYNFTEVPPKYPGEEMGIMKHAQDKILPLVSAFYKNVDLDPGNWITSLWATLYINKRGTVVDVDIPDDRVRGSLRQHLCDEFLKMKGWKPARQDSQPVCATYPYTIRCIRWQD